MLLGTFLSMNVLHYRLALKSVMAYLLTLHVYLEYTVLLLGKVAGTFLSATLRKLLNLTRLEVCH